jgi:hypothetical protein
VHTENRKGAHRRQRISAAGGEEEGGGGGRRKGYGFREKGGAAFEWSEGGRRAAAGWLSIRGHAGPASGQQRGAAAWAGQRAKPQARGRWRRRLTGGPRASGKRKTVIQLPNIKTSTSRASKIAKNLLEHDQTAKSTMQ